MIHQISQAQSLGCCCLPACLYSSCVTYFVFIISIVFSSKRLHFLTFFHSLALAPDLKMASTEVNIRTGKDRCKQLTFPFLCLANQAGEFTQFVLHEDRTANYLRAKALTSLGRWQQPCAEGRLNTAGLQERRRGSLLPRQQEVVDCPVALCQGS